MFSHTSFYLQCPHPVSANLSSFVIFHYRYFHSSQSFWFGLHIYINPPAICYLLKLKLKQQFSFTIPEFGYSISKASRACPPLQIVTGYSLQKCARIGFPIIVPAQPKEFSICFSFSYCSIRKALESVSQSQACFGFVWTTFMSSQLWFNFERKNFPKHPINRQLLHFLLFALEICRGAILNSFASDRISTLLTSFSIGSSLILTSVFQFFSDFLLMHCFNL